MGFMVALEQGWVKVLETVFRACVNELNVFVWS
jgi:hypothetical protein